MSTLYETDFYSWALEQAQALRRAAQVKLNAPAAIDWEKVAEEIESLGNEQARTLKASYRVLLMHLLKWQYQPRRRSKSWRRTIGRERINIPDHLDDNPGLKPRRHELFAAAYRLARKEAALQTGLPLATFPETCPYTLDQAMDENFWPKPAQPEALRSSDAEAQVEAPNDSSTRPTKA